REINFFRTYDGRPDEKWANEPQAGHFPNCPARSAVARKVRPHVGHFVVIDAFDRRNRPASQASFLSAQVQAAIHTRVTSRAAPPRPAARRPKFTRPLGDGGQRRSRFVARRCEAIEQSTTPRKKMPARMKQRTAKS